MENLLNQFLQSFEKTHQLIDTRILEEEKEKNDVKEDTCAKMTAKEENKRCVVCESKYSSEKDKYNWIFNGLKCCSSPIHMSCLVRWRISKKRTLDNQLIISCPKCTPKSYIPAIWFFNKFGEVLEKFIQHDKYLSNGRPSICFRYLIALHWKNTPCYYVEMKERWSKLSATEIIKTEREKLNLLTTMSETIEKRETDGLRKFIENYNTAKIGKYTDIPPLDSSGNRIACQLTAFESEDSDVILGRKSVN